MGADGEITITGLKRKIELIEEENRRLKIQNKKLKDRILGKGYAGLDMKKKFSHEEIIFLFARLLEIVGFDSVKAVHTEFPDCTAIKEGKEVFIEFEPKSMDFNHFEHKNIEKCNYVVCWEDNSDSISKESFKNSNIEIIELKNFISDGSERPREAWKKTDFEKMSKKKLYVLAAFIKKNRDTLSKEEVEEITEEYGLKGKPLGGALSGFSQGMKHKPWLIKHKTKGIYGFNSDYSQVVKETLSDLNII